MVEPKRLICKQDTNLSKPLYPNNGIFVCGDKGLGLKISSGLEDTTMHVKMAFYMKLFLLT
jgi:hypothetical protein